MFKNLAHKSYSYTHDDTAEDTIVNAALDVDTNNGALRLVITTTRTGPYIRGGRSVSEKVSNVGTINKPDLGAIRSLTAKGSNYYGFDPEWETFYGKKERNVSVILDQYKKENSSNVSTEDKKRQITDKLNELTDQELEKIRKMLRLSSEICVEEEIKRISSLITAMPMMNLNPSKEILKQAKIALMSKLGLNSQWKETNHWFLVQRTEESNKFHYFGIFQKDGVAVGGNSYGRIGYPAQAIEISSGNPAKVFGAVKAKVNQKQNKGYEWLNSY